MGVVEGTVRRRRVTVLAVITSVFAAIALTILFNPIQQSSVAGQTLSNSVTVNGFMVSYPDDWSSLRSGSVTILLNAPADQSSTLSGTQLVTTPQIRISIEQRTDQRDAVDRLKEIATGNGTTPTPLTIGGWPAIQWRQTVSWPQRGGSTLPGVGSALTITTAIAAGTQLIRLDGSLPSDSPSTLVDQVVAIENSVSFAPASSSNGWRGRSLASAAASMRHLALVEARTRLAEYRRAGLRFAARFRPGASVAQADSNDMENDLPPPVGLQPSSGDTVPSGPGAATRIINGNLVASEPEVASSSDGRNIVVAQQFVWTTSHDGGQTFPDFGVFPNSTGGDSSLAVGKSSNFYEGTIFNSSTAIHVSTDNGKTFTFRANAFTCGAGQCGFTGATIPDQEHIGADRTNATASGDQVYSAFRNGFVPPSWGIVCSTDGGATWSTGNVGISGDFPRITVGQDGFAYVAYVDGSNLMIDKFAQCSGNSGMTAQAGFPKTVATGISDIPCPVPGLDRCNNGNTLRSPMVAVDDTDASHVYYSYATSIGAGNENIIVRDSIDGGGTWPGARAVTINGGGTGRRFMPWVCTTNGTAFVSWYDRRNATGTDNDLTDYFGASASLSGGNLVAGTEFQINDPSTSDAECEAGQTPGSANSWPFGSRNANDSGSCSRQPQLGGRCQHSPPNNTDSFQACDLNAASLCPMGETCQTAGGVPKYGDYNGNACAAGHFYTVWASATPARTANPGIDMFFKVRDTVQPIAKCTNRTAPTDLNLCSAANVSIDNGSTDPDNDTFTLSQLPPGPYNKGTTPVTLTLTDQNNQTNSCNANVTVLDQQKPSISCPSPVVECTGPSGASVALNPAVSDNCPGLAAPTCNPPSGSTFPLGSTPFSCSVTDASGNLNSCSSVVKIQDTTPPVIQSVTPSPSTLWAPDHKMIQVTVAASAHNTCDPSPKCKITTITSNESPLAAGSGHSEPDFSITGPLTADLRAERSGPDSGRVYTLTILCTDASDNSSSAQTTVTVAHNQ